MDKILIRDLHVRCILGIRDDERKNKQDVIINVVISADLSRAAKTDDFADTVDYSDIKKRIVNEVEASDYYLVEALASRIADICLSYQLVEEVQVAVDKPTALRFARSVGVEMTRRK